MPAFANTNALSNLLEEKGVVVNAKPLAGSLPWWENLLLSFGPTILFIGLLVLLMRRAGNVAERARLVRPLARPALRAGRRAASRSTTSPGIDEAKAELSEVVDFLRHPEKYATPRRPHPARRAALAARPEPGKTLLARAVAGEANAPFFSMSASEFVEAIVGVGASRVRDLFVAGEGGGARDRLHRRARRDRALAHVRASPASAAATTSASRR